MNNEFTEILKKLLNSMKTKKIGLILGNSFTISPEFTFLLKDLEFLSVNLSKHFFGFSKKDGTKLFNDLLMKLKIFLRNQSKELSILSSWDEHFVSFNFLLSFQILLFDLFTRRSSSYENLSERFEAFWLYLFHVLFDSKTKKMNQIQNENYDFRSFEFQNIDQKNVLLVSLVNFLSEKSEITKEVESAFDYFEESYSLDSNPSLWTPFMKKLSLLDLKLKSFDQITELQNIFENLILTKMQKEFVSGNNEFLEKFILDFQKNEVEFEADIEKKHGIIILEIPFNQEKENDQIILCLNSGFDFLMEEVELKTKKKKILNILKMKEHFLLIDHQTRIKKYWEVKNILKEYVINFNNNMKKRDLHRSIIEEHINSDPIESKKSCSTAQMLYEEYDQITHSQQEIFEGLSLEQFNQEKEKIEEEIKINNENKNCLDKPPKILVVGKKFVGKSEMSERLSKAFKIQMINNQIVEKDIIKRYLQDEETAELKPEKPVEEKEEQNDESKIDEQKESEEKKDENENIKENENENEKNLTDIEENETKIYNLTTFEERKFCRSILKGESANEEFIFEEMKKRMEALRKLNRGYIVEINLKPETNVEKLLFSEFFISKDKNQISQKKEIYFDEIIELDISNEDLEFRLENMFWINLIQKEEIEENNEEKNEKEDSEEDKDQQEPTSEEDPIIQEDKMSEKSKIINPLKPEHGEIIISKNQLKNLEIFTRSFSVFNKEDFEDFIQKKSSSFSDKGFEKKFFNLSPIFEKLQNEPESLEKINLILQMSKKQKRNFWTEEAQDVIRKHIQIYMNTFKPMINSILQKNDFGRRFKSVNIEGLSREQIYFNILNKIHYLKSQVYAFPLESESDLASLIKNPTLSKDYQYEPEETEEKDNLHFFLLQEEFRNLNISKYLIPESGKILKI